jgi:large subunit ribosomal protein L9
MEVLLARNVDNLGRVGDVVRVAPGYARNYLFPKGLARAVTAANLARIEADRKRVLRDEGERLERLKDMAERIATTNVTIEAKAGPEGNLYGSVTSAMVAEELRKAGFEVTPEDVRLEHSLKQVGVFSVPVHLHHDIQTEARVWVVRAKE